LMLSDTPAKLFTTEESRWDDFLQRIQPFDWHCFGFCFGVCDLQGHKEKHIQSTFLVWVPGRGSQTKRLAPRSSGILILSPLGLVGAAPPTLVENGFTNYLRNAPETPQNVRVM
jgi:hypothetical protein